MAKTNFEMVSEFNDVLGQGVRSSIGTPSQQQQKLRLDLIYEEAVDELGKAMFQDDLVEVADAIADSLVVVYGAGCDYGLDMDMLMHTVHVSNMSKLANSESEAQYAVSRYRAGDGFHGKEEPIPAAYRPCEHPDFAGKFIIYNEETGKTLKSATFHKPKIREALEQMQAAKQAREAQSCGSESQAHTE